MKRNKFKIKKFKRSQVKLQINKLKNLI